MKGALYSSDSLSNILFHKDWHVLLHLGDGMAFVYGVCMSACVMGFYVGMMELGFVPVSTVVTCKVCDVEVFVIG